MKIFAASVSTTSTAFVHPGYISAAPVNRKESP
jgi:hypothetical protein